MIRRGENKDMIARRKVRPNGRIWEAQMVFHGARLVWQAIRSCFGTGAWLEERPWLNDDAWKD